MLQCGTYNREGRVILLRSVSFEIEIKLLFSNDVEFACLISFDPASPLLIDIRKITCNVLQFEIENLFND